MFSEEEKPQDKESVKELKKLSQKLDFIDSILITGDREVKVTREVLEEDDEKAEVELPNDLYVGELNDGVILKINEVLEVDLTENEDFRLTGQFEFNVYEISKTRTPTYLLVGETGRKTEILFLEEALLEIFEEAEGLQRVSIIGTET